MNLTFKKIEAGRYIATTPEGWEVEVAKHHSEVGNPMVYVNGEALNYYWCYEIHGMPNWTDYYGSNGDYDATMAACKKYAGWAYENAVEQVAKYETITTTPEGIAAAMAQLTGGQA